MTIIKISRTSLFLKRIFSLIAAIVVIGCSGGHGGGNSSTEINTGNQSTLIATAEITEKGGVAILENIASVEVPAKFVTVPTTIKVESIVDDNLDIEFSNGTDVFSLVDMEESHLVISGLVEAPTVPAMMRIKIKLSSALAGQVNDTVIPQVMVWSLDEEQEGEAAESLSAPEILPSEYDPNSKELTVEVSSDYLSKVDPVTHLATKASFQVVLRVGLIKIPSEEPNAPVTAVQTTVSKEVASTRATATTATTPLCGTADWKSPLSDYRSIAAFSEVRKNRTSGHGGLDIVTRDEKDLPITKLPVLAVADGYVETVKSEACNISKNGGPIKCTAATNPGYALVLALNNGDRIAYRHLQPGGIEVAGLKAEKDILKYWKDDGTRKYKVKTGNTIAQTGASGNVAPHLHIEYFPNPKNGDIGIRNPLCKLVKFEAKPDSLMMNAGATANVKTKLNDRDGNEYKIRRSISKNLFLSASAIPINPLSDFEPLSRSIMVKVDKTTTNQNVFTIDPNWIDPDVGISSDNGFVRLNSKQEGSSLLTLTPSFPWKRDGTMVPFGKPVVVPVAVAATVAKSPYEFCIYNGLPVLKYPTLAADGLPNTSRYFDELSCYSDNGFRNLLYTEGYRNDGENAYDSQIETYTNSPGTTPYKISGKSMENNIVYSVQKRNGYTDLPPGGGRDKRPQVHGAIDMRDGVSAFIETVESGQVIRRSCSAGYNHITVENLDTFNYTDSLIPASQCPTVQQIDAINEIQHESYPLFRRHRITKLVQGFPSVTTN